MGKEDIRRDSFPVLGMMCAVCAGSVEKVLLSMDGVESADVNLAANSVSVKWHSSLVSPMEMARTVAAAGYELIVTSDEEAALKEQEEKQRTELRGMARRLWLAWIVTIPLTIGCLFHIHDRWFAYIAMLSSLAVILFCGWGFYVRGFKAMLSRRASMDTLVALSTGISFSFSVFATFAPDFFTDSGLTASLYYEASAMIIAFVLTGKYLETRAKKQTGSAIKALMGLQPSTALLCEGLGDIKEVKVSSLGPGDVIMVRPGTRIPADGFVVEGNSSVDESMLSGEPAGVEKGIDSKVWAGTVNGRNTLKVKVTESGSGTVLSGIIRMVREAQGSKPPVQRLVDRISSVFVPAVMFLSIITFVIWMLCSDNDLAFAVTAAVSVLVIACPCAMGLATPTALTAGIGLGAINRILIKEAKALETLSKINTVVFDKTGTLTEGVMKVSESILADNFESADLGAVLALELQSEHPLSRAICDWAEARDAEVLSAEDVRVLPGYGIEGKINGEQWWIGSLNLMKKKRICLNGKYEKRVSGWVRDGAGIAVAGTDNGIKAIWEVADTVNPTASSAVSGLKRMDITPVLLTGDHKSAGLSVAGKVGIEEVRSDALPQDKENFVKEIQAQGKKVAMVGDGINDTQALARADVSIAMGGGTDIAMDVADVTLIGSDLRLVPAAVKLSGATIRVIRENLFWAFIYNIIGLPVAAGVLYPAFGIMLNPMICSGAMALSSICVVLNSLRLRKLKLQI